MPRNDYIAPLVTPGHRFLWGLTLLLMFLFSQGLIPRLIQVLLFAGLASAAGKRIRYTYFLILVFSITAFNLLSPWGEVLFSVGSISVTRGALLTGLTKGVTISGLVFVSLFSVSRDLVLPGRLGRLLGRSFYYFERLYGQKRRVHRRTFFSDVDEILLSLFPADEAASVAANGSRTRPGGVFLILLTLGVGGFLVLNSYLRTPLI